jgi:hypothetical protein
MASNVILMIEKIIFFQIFIIIPQNMDSANLSGLSYTQRKYLISKFDLN